MSLAAMMLSTLGVSAAEPAASAAEAAVAVATVVAVDDKIRDITLALPEGEKWTFAAGPEVRNFAQIKRGDRVIASYFAGFALALGPKGSGIKARYDTLTGERAKPGEKPAATVTRTTEATGVVKTIDPKNRLVTLQGVERTIALTAYIRTNRGMEQTALPILSIV